LCLYAVVVVRRLGAAVLRSCKPSDARGIAGALQCRVLQEPYCG